MPSSGVVMCGKELIGTATLKEENDTMIIAGRELGSMTFVVLTWPSAH